MRVPKSNRQFFSSNIFIYMKKSKCEYCEQEHNSSYGSGRFCNRSCAAGFSTKNKRKEINKKVSKTLTGTGNPKITKHCLYCNSKLILSHKRRNKKFCNNSCGSSHVNSDPAVRKRLSEVGKKRCESLEERKRLRDIGRKGGFGKKGYTESGIRYDSSIEEKCFYG